MFVPTGYFASGDVWTPADATGIKYWWRADSGVTLSGTDVTAWEDQIAGHTLTPSATSPKFVASDTSMNNQPAIEFGSVDTSEVLANTTEVAAGGEGFAWFVISTTTNADGGFQIIGGFKGLLGAAGHEMVIETNNPSYSNSFTTYTYEVGPSGGDETNTGVSVSAPEKSWVGIGHDNATGQNYFYRNGTSYLIGVGGDNPDTLAFCVGNYGTGGGLEYYGNVLECGWLSREYWTAPDAAQFSAYVSTRYGI